MSCLFCRIVKGEIPSFKLIETAKTLAFLDVGPLNKGHALVIPKEHAEKMHELSDASLADLLPVAKKVALAVGSENYNILQNNGAEAHQEVGHVHFHIIPKKSIKDESEGLVVGWPATKGDMGELKAYAEELRAKIE
ncbi:HIT-like protein [Protomyces lactucae-debilis]|uniref:HIT-like protein n=1 Tax=Protomyces lactucae-debilis TaxID=2754530 RepID=A0A1Y2FMI1_PROLT|nr:HIT-like protein [Protomyces lactucae-debilis]ORY84436.1 HIT-like protein [Protomyces lactucae-debilis]